MTKINIPADALRRFLETHPDSEAIGAEEYVADLYDAARPMTVNLSIGDNGAVLLAAAELLFDEEQDGWYMGRRIDDVYEVERALGEAMAVNE